MGERRGWGVVLAAMAFAVAAPSAAQEPPPVPVVRIADVGPVIVSFSCGAIDATITGGEVVVARTGDLIDGLSVTFEITESPYLSPGILTFQPTEDTASILMGFGSVVPRGEIVVTLVDEDGYDLGDPSTARVPVDVSAVERDCPPYDPRLPPEPRVVDPTFTG